MIMNQSDFKNPSENAIEFTKGDRTATVTFSQAKYANRIKMLADKYPEQVKILAEGKSNGGYMYAHVPVEWIKIIPSRQLSEQRKEALRSQASTIRKHRNEQ